MNASMRKRAMRDLRKLLTERGVKGFNVYHLETDKCIRCHVLCERETKLVPKKFMGFHVVTEFQLLSMTNNPR